MGRRSRRISTRARIVGAILAVAFVGLVVVGAVTFIVQRESVLAAVDNLLTAQVEALNTVEGSGGAPAPDAGDPAAVAVLNIDDYATVSDYMEAAVLQLVPGTNQGSVGVIDGVARFVPETQSGFDISGNQQLINHAVADTERQGGTAMGTAVTDQGTLRYIAVPVTKSGDPEHGVYIRAVDLDAVMQPVITSMMTYVITALTTMVGIAIVCWFVVGRLLSPIRYLRDTADSITITELGARIPAPGNGNDDLSDLTRTVNSMLDRLEGSVDVQRQLLDDVRHELKTPITIVRGHLEMMDATDTMDVETAREIGIAELDRMARLVDDIDLLATVEGDQIELRPVDIDDLTLRVGERVAGIPGHTWSIEAIGAGQIEGDADRLLQAWLALADNASKYTAPGSPIEIGSAFDERGARLWVRDHGPGIPPASRHRIFRRFDRAQGRRTVGGSGLGLAIVDAITRGHGGSCSVTDTPGGGATFIIHVPLRAGAPADLPAPVRAGDVVLQREATG